MRVVPAIDETKALPASEVRPVAPDRAALVGSIGPTGRDDVATCGEQPLGFRMVLSDEIVLESRDDTHVVIANLARGTRVRVSQGIYRFMHAFRRPRRVDEVLSSHDTSRAMPHVRMLLDKNLLENADAPPPATHVKVRTAAAYRFCNAPALVSGQPTDFVVLGIPYDLTADTDGRLAPNLIRQKSLNYPYQLRFDDAVPRGWFDADRATNILSGATIADAGDVYVDHGETKAQFHERVAIALAQSCGGRSVPLILGGDRSVTYATLAGLPNRRELAVVQLTADTTNSAVDTAEERLREIEHVRHVAILDPCSKAAGITDALGGANNVYLSIDLASSVRALGAEEGPSIQNLKSLITSIGAAHAIIGIDLVGLDMRDQAYALAGITGCQLALTAMSAAHDRGAA